MPSADHTSWVVAELAVRVLIVPGAAGIAVAAGLLEPPDHHHARARSACAASGSISGSAHGASLRTARWATSMMTANPAT